MRLLDALPVELRRSIVFAIIQTPGDLNQTPDAWRWWLIQTPDVWRWWRRTVRTLHRLEATSKAWKELVGESAVWLAVCEFCWPQQTRMLAAAAVIESYRQFCKKKLTVFQLPPTPEFGMKDLWWTVEVSCYDVSVRGGEEIPRHLVARTAHFEALPDDGWLTFVLDEPITLFSLADAKFGDEPPYHRSVFNCWLRLRWSAFRRTDQKMVELLSDTPQETCDIDIPEDTTSDAECFCSVMTSPAEDHNVDTYQLGGNDTIEMHADHGFTYRFAGPPDARVLQLVSLSLSYFVGWDASHPRARFCGRDNEHEFMRFLDYQGWQ